MVAVLDFLAAQPGQASASAIARALGLNGSTCAAVLASLERAAYVERAADKTYRLGRGLLPLVDALRVRFPLLGLADDELGRLSHELGCACSLVRIYADHLLVLLAAGSGVEALEGARPSRRFPLDPPYGSVAVAWRAPDEIERWLDQSPAHPGPAERARYRRLLADIRALGYGVWSLETRDVPLLDQVREALDALRGDAQTQAVRARLIRLFATFGRHGYLASELEAARKLSVSYMIAPVFGPDAQPRYQLVLHLLRPSVRREELDRFAKRLRSAAATLSTAIGIRGSSPEDAGADPAAKATERQVRARPRRRGYG